MSNWRTHCGSRPNEKDDCIHKRKTREDYAKHSKAVLSRPRVSAYQHYPQPGPVNWVRTFSKLEYNKGLTDFHVGGVAVINSQKFLLARKTLMEVLQRVQSHAKQLDLIRRQPKQSVAESTRTLHMRNRKARTVGIQSYTIIYNCPIIQPSSTINWYQYPPTPGNRRGRVRDKVPFRAAAMPGAHRKVF